MYGRTSSIISTIDRPLCSDARRHAVSTTADPIAGVDVGHWCRDQIEGSQFVLMENSGHWPQFEEPDLFNRVHIEFLSGRRVPGRAQP